MTKPSPIRPNPCPVCGSVPSVVVIWDDDHSQRAECGVIRCGVRGPLRKTRRGVAKETTRS